jgi:hypothetical protein
VKPRKRNIMARPRCTPDLGRRAGGGYAVMAAVVFAVMFVVMTWGRPVAVADPKPANNSRTNPNAGSSTASTASTPSTTGSITENVDCTTCHSTETWKNSLSGAGSEAGGAGVFNHDKTGFPLRGRHQEVTCTGCHQPKRQVQSDCVSCHKDPHQGLLGRLCETCHSARTWADTNTKAIEIHRRTRFPLTGFHVLADCTQCHQRRGEREWSAPPSNCYACHEADYNQPGLRPSHIGAAGETPFPRDCSMCHRAAGWRPARRDQVPARALAMLVRDNPSDHDMRFVISRGAHQGAACGSCHLSESNFRSVRCDGCHEHSAARLQQQHQGRPVPLQGSTCLSCHPGGMAR